jgi:dTDP-4-dehydrorhamnose reductase
VSWYDFAGRIAEGAGYDPSVIERAPASEPAVTALASVRGALLRPFDEALRDYLDRVEVPAAPEAMAAE